MQFTLDNERELLRQVAAGDEQAYRVLFGQYADRMYGNALHFTKSPALAQDLTQESVRVLSVRHRVIGAASVAQPDVEEPVGAEGDLSAFMVRERLRHLE